MTVRLGTGKSVNIFYSVVAGVIVLTELLSLVSWSILNRKHFAICRILLPQSSSEALVINYRIVVPARHATQPGGIGSLKSILRLLKSLKTGAECIF